ncbi:uncharacterized protein LOC131633055 [Vicia villosa]|uniref:uncharacterized protein LOC131633055 n=1 Tax=Vicia villosa TaxID=3911 RepID=UPI00273C8962|nr:uncharacterized protein LOC131633055 [Vicia villosa]
MDESAENQNAKVSKRQWTAEEDAILVEGLLQLVDDGWKEDAGTFKPGYTKVLEKYLHKKNQTIKDMMGPSASGFGWDDARKMIIVEKEVYSQWCKSHPTASGLYGKPFPHFDNFDVVLIM